MGALDLVDQWDAPGAAAGVVREPSPAVLGTRGDVEQPQRWASVTKLATALAVLIAVEEGSLDLDTPAGPPGATVRHLLAHASGLAFSEHKVRAAPGRRRIYSNAGYEALATVAAGRTGIPFESYLTEGVLDPLGMDSTRLKGSPAHGLVGPLTDLLRLAAELLAPTLISSATMQAATSVAFAGLAGTLPGFGRQDPMDWGLGFELRDAKSPHWTGARNSPGTFGHFGGSGSFLWVDPEVGLGCASLSGRDFGPWAIDSWPVLADAVLAEFSGTDRSSAS